MSRRLRMPSRSLAALLSLAVLGACGAGAPSAAPAGAGAPASASIGDPSRQRARSAVGVVSSASVLATAVGAGVLAEGGNAVDAAVATAFALAVTEPSMSGIGGRSAIVIRTPSGEIFAIDGLNEVPGGFREGGSEGYERVAVPGVPAALDLALGRYGSWPLDRVLGPAIRLAEEGFVLPEEEARRLAGAADDLRRHPGSAEAFLRADGTAYEAGDRFAQPALARTLRAIAEGGVETLYTGWIADSIHADMARAGGFVTREDLARYRALPAIVVRGTYRGHEVLSAFRPASGHAVIQALHTLEALPAEGLADPTRWAALVGEATRAAIADRSLRVGSEAESARRLTSREHARERAERILDGLPPREDAAEPPDVLVGAAGDRDATTHMSAADRDGWFVALTQSLGPAMGTRVVSPGLGFLYATRLGSEPGSRPSSTISPTVVLRPDRAPAFALGGAGDARIISAVIQVISRVLDHGMTLEEAVRAPRVHPLGESELRVEEGPIGAWSAGVVEGLAALGLSPVGSPSSYFGRVHAVALEEDGILGVAEPRWNGGAAGPLR